MLKRTSVRKQYLCTQKDEIIDVRRWIIIRLDLNFVYLFFFFSKNYLFILYLIIYLIVFLFGRNPHGTHFITKVYRTN